MERRRKALLAGLTAVLLTFTVLAGLISTGSQEEELLIGTENGNLLSYNGQNIKSEASIPGTIHQIETWKNKVYLSSQNGNNSVLWSVGDKTKKVYSSEKKFHGFAFTKENIFLGLQDTEELVKISKSGRVLQRKNISGKPHQLAISEDKLYVGKINGTIAVYNKDLERENNLKFGNWIGSFSKEDELLVAGRKGFQVNSSGHVHTATEGFVTSFAEGRKRTVRLGATFVPHGVIELENNKIAVTNMVNGTVAIVDMNEGKLVEKITLEPRGEPYFTSLLTNYRDKLLTGDIEKDRIYFINPKNGEVTRSLKIASLHSIYVS